MGEEPPGSSSKQCEDCDDDQDQAEAATTAAARRGLSEEPFFGIVQVNVPGKATAVDRRGVVLTFDSCARKVNDEADAGVAEEFVDERIRGAFGPVGQLAGVDAGLEDPVLVLLEQAGARAIEYEVDRCGMIRRCRKLIGDLGAAEAALFVLLELGARRKAIGVIHHVSGELVAGVLRCAFDGCFAELFGDGCKGALAVDRRE